MSTANDHNAPTIAEFRNNHGKVGGYFEARRSCCYTRSGPAAVLNASTP